MQQIPPEHAIAYSQDKNNNLIAIAYSTIAPGKADKVVENVRDLIDDPNYRPFFYKHLYRLGPAKFVALAERARKGKSPGRLFVTLLRTA